MQIFTSISQFLTSFQDICPILNLNNVFMFSIWIKNFQLSFNSFCYIRGKKRWIPCCMMRACCMIFVCIQNIFFIKKIKWNKTNFLLKLELKIDCNPFSFDKCKKKRKKNVHDYVYEAIFSCYKSLGMCFIKRTWSKIKSHNSSYNKKIIN